MSDSATRKGGAGKSVTFCFPYRGSGGVPMQFLRLSSELSNRGWKVHLVDYADGTMRRNLRDQHVKTIDYGDDTVARIPDHTILVFQTMTPWSIFPRLQVPDGTRLLFWTCHPFNLVPTVPGLRRLVEIGPGIGALTLRFALPGCRWRLKKFLGLMQARRSVVFMDIGTMENTAAYLNERISSPVFVPIPVPPGLGREKKAASSSGGPVRIGWVGRIADFKYPILIHCLRRLNSIAPALGRAVKVSIVGSGGLLAALKTEAAKLPHLEVEFLGEFAPDQVRDFLHLRVDLMVAMGTSALEAAHAGVPTILLDFSYRQVPARYRFRWLHEREGYSLGELIGRRHLGTGDDELRTRLEEMLQEPDRLSSESVRYAERNHALKAVTDRLEDALGGAQLTWGEVRAAGLLDRPMAYRLHKFLRRQGAN